MKKLYYILPLLISIIIAACEFNIEPVELNSFMPTELKGTKDVTEFIKDNTEGIYVSKSSFKPLGDTVVLKWSGNVLSIFTGKSTIYSVLQTGYKNDEIIFEGFWRHANSTQNGVIQLKITSDNGGKELVRDELPDELKLTGLHGNVDSDKQSANLKELSFLKVGNLRPKQDDYYIIAHKGGGRNIDRLPHSENTIELIKYSSYLGANSIEIDVRLTKDKVPVLFHDEYLSLRTVNNEYLIGKITEYSWKLLRTSAPLTFGEKIPTLEEALETVLNETNHKLVWLDVKVAEALPAIKTIQKKYLDKSEQMGRGLEILIGVPDMDVYNELKKLTDFRNIPTLCELDEQYVDELNSEIWAPRWSLGLLEDRIKTIHDKGKRAFVWTLDDPKLVRKYVRESDFDGMVSNYSSVVAYEYYLGN